jgi:N-acetylmuramoyl-L-alanine amidase
MSGSRRVIGVLLSLASLSLLGAGVRPPGLGDVRGIELREEAERTRVVIELSREASYQTHWVGNPPRLYVDIDGIWIEPPHRSEHKASPQAAVRLVRGGQNTLERARIVLELGGADLEHRTFHLVNPFRIVTDVFPAGDLAPVDSGGGREFDVRPVRRVVIDAGHGGKDPGARGSGGLREKDVTLRIARELRARLARAGLDVVLTRDRDEYLTLEQRTALANRADADLFVSIHANAAPNRSRHGVETYLLDTRYDRQTARVAARENGTSIEALSEVDMILASLRLGYNERYAARLADHVQGSLVRQLRGHHRGTVDLGVKHGPFLVLFMSNMPAVLVEVGFVSNRAEASRLRSDSFARAAAEGIADGILAHQRDHARRLMAER